MVDFPWLSSFNGVYNIDIDLYIYIIYIHILSWVSNPTRNDARPFVKNLGTVHNVFLWLGFLAFQTGPKVSDTKDLPKEVPIDTPVKDPGKQRTSMFWWKSSCNIYSQWICFWLECHMNMARRMVAVFVDHVFLRLFIFTTILWREMIQFDEHRVCLKIRHAVLWILLRDGFKYVFFYVFFLFGPGKLNLFWWNTGKLNLPVLINKHGFLLLWGGRGTFMIMRQKKRTFSFIQTDPFWGWCDVFVKFDSPTAALENSQRPSKEKAPETVPVKAPESVPVSPKNDPPVQHGYCCRGWGSTRVGRMMATIR